MRLLTGVRIGIAAGLVAGAMALATPADARGGGAGGGGFGGGDHGFAFGFRSPGFAFNGARSPAFRSRLFARQFFGRPFFGRPFFGRPYAAVVPFGFGYGFGGYGYAGGGDYGPGLPIYDVPPYLGQGPAYSQRTRPREPDRTPIETAALIAPAIPGSHPPPIPAVITPYEVRPGTMPTHDVAGAGPPLPTVLAGR